ncbi:hypothetical protein ACQPW1_10005 [Nocardia sp. CA-128927]|uniref:hypothetical protein n=1 Tax=Nocardia sp. CA-128927 TaxID=3239975 RepID=UPI003D965257
MAAASTKSPKKITAEPAESAWAKLVREAKKNYTPPPPYVLDAFDPPVLITAPDGLERSLALAKLADAGEYVSVDELIPMLEALVGADVFPKVWELIRNEVVDVALALIDDINVHFNQGADAGAGELPGGESAS